MRQAALTQRDALTAGERATRSADIAATACQLLEPRIGPRVAVALYAPKGSEVETSAIDQFARGRGARVAYPRVVGVRAPLAFAAAGPEDLIAGRFGLREPALTAPPIDLGAIAAFVVPGLAFDRSGGRIGWGHGYYDATLAAAEPTALRIGLAFELQLIDRVPRDAHDVALHAVITEAATYWVA